MTRALISFLIVCTLSACNSTPAEKAGVSVSRTPVETPELPDSDTSPAVRGVKEQHSQPEVRNDSLIPVINRDGKDTLIGFSRFDAFEFPEINLPALRVTREEDVFVITHPRYEFKLREMPFDTAMNELVFDAENVNQLLLVNDHLIHGTDGDIPKSQFSRFTYRPVDGDVEIVNPVYYEDLYNMGFRIRNDLTNPRAYRIRNNGCIIRIDGSDGAGSYVALFLMDNEGNVIRRSITKPF